MSGVPRLLAAAVALCLAACHLPPPPARPPISSARPSTVRLASFNALRLGHARKKTASDPAMVRLAGLIRGFDAVALQEVMTPQAAEELARALRRLDPMSGWSVVVSPRAIGRGTYREHSAVAYRSDQVRLIPGSAGIVPDPQDAFVREPFFASFRAEAFDFTLVVVHLDAPGRAAGLTREIRALAEVYRSIQEADPAEDDVILCGDFNRSCRSPEFAGLRGIESVEPLLNPPPSTTLNDEGPANAYDQIWVQRKFTVEFTGRWGVVDSVRAGAAASYRAARSELSDHLPVWAEFRCDRDDDPSGLHPE